MALQALVDHTKASKADQEYTVRVWWDRTAWVALVGLSESKGPVGYGTTIPEALRSLADDMEAREEQGWAVTEVMLTADSSTADAEAKEGVAMAKVGVPIYILFGYAAPDGESTIRKVLGFMAGPGLAVTPHLQGWDVTHLATGLLLPRFAELALRFPDYADNRGGMPKRVAFAWAKALSQTGVDWEKVTLQDWPAIRQRVKEHFQEDAGDGN
jgi:hypothetical protein